MNRWEKCPCTGVTIAKLIHPTIMTVLAEGGLHGYRIVELSSQTPMLGGSCPDPTGVYRVLRTMENEGFVKASWCASERGPKKKTYHLTAKGRKCLTRWTKTLAVYHRATGMLLATARKALSRTDRTMMRRRVRK